jgi:hypothetical protein
MRGVAEFNEKRERVGRVHRPQQEPTAKRNRSQYRTSCGRIVRYGLPVLVAPASAICLHCYPNARDRSEFGWPAA